MIMSFFTKVYSFVVVFRASWLGDERSLARLATASA
jgi:hypothetical protein